MDLKLSALFLVALCLAQAASVPVTARDYETQKPKTQYGIVKLSAEATVLRMRIFLTAIDVNFSIKNSNVQIFANLQALGVDPAKVTSLKNEMTSRTETVNSNLLRVLDYTQQLIDHVNQINHNVAYNPDRLTADLARLVDLETNTQVVYDTARENIGLVVEIMQLKIEGAVAGMTGPLVDEVHLLVNDGVTLMTSHRSKCDLERTAMAATIVDTKTRLQALIDQL